MIEMWLSKHPSAIAKDQVLQQCNWCIVLRNCPHDYLNLNTTHAYVCTTQRLAIALHLAAVRNKLREKSRLQARSPAGFSFVAVERPIHPPGLTASLLKTRRLVAQSQVTHARWAERRLYLLPLVACARPPSEHMLALMWHGAIPPPSYHPRV